jgi:hypothetical protein
MEEIANDAEIRLPAGTGWGFAGTAGVETVGGCVGKEDPPAFVTARYRFPPQPERTELAAKTEKPCNI